MESSLEASTPVHPQPLDASLFEEDRDTSVFIERPTEITSEAMEDKRVALHPQGILKTKQHRSERKRLKKERKRHKKELKALRKSQKKLQEEHFTEEAEHERLEEHPLQTIHKFTEVDNSLEASLLPTNSQEGLFVPLGAEGSEPNIHMEPSRDGVSTYFDEVLERLKKRKAKKQRLSTSESIEFVHGVLQQMKEAREADERALEEHRPAVAKLQMLDYTAEILAKPKWRELFVSEGCCQALASWLAPSKDDKLPNVTIRRKILNLIEKLPIQAQELQNNDLGVVLVLLWKHEDETEENRTIIRGLIQRWMRPLLGLGSSFKEFRLSQNTDMQKVKGDNEIMESTAEAKLSPSQPQPINRIIESTETIDTSKYRRAVRPQVLGFNFVVQPKSDINLDRQKLQKKPKGALNRLLEAAKLPRIPRQAQKKSYQE